MIKLTDLMGNPVWLREDNIQSVRPVTKELAHAVAGIGSAHANEANAWLTVGNAEIYVQEKPEAVVHLLTDDKTARA